VEENPLNQDAEMRSQSKSSKEADPPSKYLTTG